MTKTEIRRDYVNGDLAYIYAIAELQAIGYSGKEAEEIVEKWDEIEAQAQA